MTSNDVVQDSTRASEAGEPIVVVPSPRASLLSGLPVIDDVIVESRLARIVSFFTAIALCACFFIHIHAYWVPAHPGSDQNGYLVGGKLIAETLTMKFAPSKPGSAFSAFDPFQYVGQMWVGTNYGKPDEAFYPKYPIGLPLLYAASLWIGGEHLGPLIAYSISPVAMTLAVLATFLLAREFLRSPYALLALIVFMSSPVTMGLSTNPNSHATAVCCVTWGLYFLRRWWATGGAYRASAAGLLIGYAATIRYSEGALIVLVVFTLIMRMAGSRQARQARQDAKNENEISASSFLSASWRSWRTWRLGAKDLREYGWLLLGWLIPVGALVTYNLIAIGRLTGYDQTNESTGFKWEYVSDNWETLLRHLNTNGVAFLLPVTAIGLAWMIRRAWRDAVWIALWVLPCVAIYISYYWAPDPQNQQNRISYLRFFTTILPALIIAAMWAFEQFVEFVRRTHSRRASAWFTLGMGVVVATTVGVHLDNAKPVLEEDQLVRLRVKLAADEIRADVPNGSVLLLQDEALAQHIQFVGDYNVYLPAQTFTNGWIHGWLKNGGSGQEEPQLLDPARRAALFDRLKDFDQPRLDEALRTTVSVALERNLRVFAVLQRDGTGEVVGGAAPRSDRAGRRSANRKGSGKGAQARDVPAMLERVLKSDAFVMEVVRAWYLQIPRSEPPKTPRGDRAPKAVPPRAYQLIEITKNAAPSAPKPIPLAPAPKAASPKDVSPKNTSTTKPKPEPKAERKPAATTPVTVTTKPATTTKPIDPRAETKPVEGVATQSATTKPVEALATQPVAKPSEPAATKPTAIPTGKLVDVPASQPTTRPVDPPSTKPSVGPATVPDTQPSSSTTAPATKPT